MMLEFKCFECDHINTWPIDPIKISEFACQKCRVPIAYSNGIVIKTYEAMRFDDHDRYRLYESVVESPRISYSFYTGTYSTGTYYHTSSTGSTW